MAKTWKIQFNVELVFDDCVITGKIVLIKTIG